VAAAPALEPPAPERRLRPQPAPAREGVAAPRSTPSRETAPVLPRRGRPAAATLRGVAELHRAPPGPPMTPLPAPTRGRRSEAVDPRLVAPRCPATAARPRRTAPPQWPAAAPLRRPRAAIARCRPAEAVPRGWRSAASPCRPTTTARRAIAADREAHPCRPQSSPESSGLARSVIRLARPGDSIWAVEHGSTRRRLAPDCAYGRRFAGGWCMSAVHHHRFAGG
jgi:hypothetical protein